MAARGASQGRPRDGRKSLHDVEYGPIRHFIACRLKAVLPIAVLAWLGVDTRYQGQGLGKRLLAQALQDCYQASQVFPFVAVVLDCVDDKAREFYQTFQFASLPGHPYKLYLSFGQMEALLAIAPPHP